MLKSNPNSLTFLVVAAAGAEIPENAVLLNAFTYLHLYRRNGLMNN